MKKFLSLFLAFVVAFGAPLPSYAAYAQLAPPPGWSQGLGAASANVGNNFKFASAATATTVLLGRIGANAALTVAGRTVAVPATVKLAANAGLVGATYSFGNPYLFVGIAAGTALYNWYHESGFTPEGNIWWRDRLGACSVGPCYVYILSGSSNQHSTAQGACDELGASFGGAGVLANEGSFCYGYNADGYYINGRGIGKVEVSPSPGTREPATFDDFVEKLRNKPLPDYLPKLLPEVEWPVERPVLNPDPADKTKGKPFWVPTGNPIKNPSVVGQPDTWTQPGVRVTPSPTVANPWQVDVVPEDKTKDNSTPNVDESVDEPTSPSKPEKIEIETCGLPGKPPCKIDEAGTPTDGEKPFEKAKTSIDTAKDAAKAGIDSAAIIEAPSWTFTFQLPTGCAPYVTGLRGVILNVCQWQSTIHDLMSMIWAGSTFFCIAGMVGRTIRES